MALKLDMSKAYNWVEWIFLEKILLKMGFQALWVGLIMLCITTVSFSNEWGTQWPNSTFKRFETR